MEPLAVLIVGISVLADIFVPYARICGDVVGQQPHACVGIQIDYIDAVFAQPVDAALKVDRLAYDNSADAELTNEAAAVPARRKRSGHNRVAIARPPAGVPECIGLAVRGRVRVLDPSVVPSTE